MALPAPLARYIEAVRARDSQPLPFWLVIGVTSGLAIALFSHMENTSPAISAASATVGVSAFLPIMLPRLGYDYLKRLAALITAIATFGILQAALGV